MSATIGLVRNNNNLTGLFMCTRELCFVMDFPSNHWFFNKIVVHEELFCWLLLLVSSSSHNDSKGREKTKKQRIKCAPQKLFGRLLWHYCMTNIVKRDQKYGNAMVAFVPKIIAVSSIMIVASSISSEIPVERLFNHIRGHFFLSAMHVWGAVGQ